MLLLHQKTPQKYEKMLSKLRCYPQFIDKLVEYFHIKKRTDFPSPPFDL